MELVTYQDYKSYKHIIIQGMDRTQCALFNAVVMKYLFDKYSIEWKQDLLDTEQISLVKMVDFVWRDQYIDVNLRKDLPEDYEEFEKIGFDEDGDPDDLSPETIDVLSSVEYAVSEKYGAFQETIIYVLELLSDGVDRELNMKCPDYIYASLDNMFQYQEMRDLVSNMELAVDSIQKGRRPEYVLSLFQ
jgi:hypothetical protein